MSDDQLAEAAIRALGDQPEASAFLLARLETEPSADSINGKALGPIRVKEGQRVLFHILNASATENIQLSLPGHDFLVVALDGNPVPRPRHCESLLLGAAERVDAIVEMNNPGIWILGSTDDDVRGAGLGILVEYAGKKGQAILSKTVRTPWDYTLFGVEHETREPDATIPILIE